jgi:hypothetical protein
VAAASPKPKPTRPARIRWDRVSRVAMLFVLAVLLYLAISPVRSLISEMHLTAARSAQLHRLQGTANELAAQLHGLSQASTAGAEARNLGYVRPGEHEFVISGLPNN